MKSGYFGYCCCWNISTTLGAEILQGILFVDWDHVHWICVKMNNLAAVGAEIFWRILFWVWSNVWTALLKLISIFPLIIGNLHILTSCPGCTLSLGAKGMVIVVLLTMSLLHFDQATTWKYKACVWMDVKVRWPQFEQPYRDVISASNHEWFNDWNIFL